MFVNRKIEYLFGIYVLFSVSAILRMARVNCNVSIYFMTADML